MIEIDVEIKNFGKIKSAVFKVRPFTVIAGKNASGKSFVSRGLYTIFNALNKDHLSIEIDGAIFRISRFFYMAKHVVSYPSRKVEAYIYEMYQATEKLKKSVDFVFHQGTFIDQVSQKDLVSEEIQRLYEAFDDFGKDISGINKYDRLFESIDVVKADLKSLGSLVKNPQILLSKSLRKQLENDFVDNFQVGINNLKNKFSGDGGDIVFDFGESVGSLRLNSNHLAFALENKGVDDFQKIDNVVYLESPVYWKIKDALREWVDLKKAPYLRRIFKHKEKEFKKVPNYILDTFRLLESDILRDEVSSDILDIKASIDKIIGGNIDVSDGGRLQFINRDEKGSAYTVDLHQEASGSIALGIISLLLDKGIIAPNSILIFDEPEVNLHPAWQHVLIQVLYKLSLSGIQIIMASHSLDMMESIEKMMRRHKKEYGKEAVGDHFSILQLDNGVSLNEDKPIFKKMDAVKGDLGMPLFDLYSGGE